MTGVIEPTADEIAAMCLMIRLEWDETETLKRLRCDWRPGTVNMRRYRAATGEPASDNEF